MEKKFFVFVLFILFGILTFQAQTTAIPDANFEDYLETHDNNGGLVDIGDDNSLGDGIADNGLVFTDRINTLLSLVISDLNIFDLTGIEDFTALETLICNANSLSVLNIANNTNLKTLLGSSNQLITLDNSLPTNQQIGRKDNRNGHPGTQTARPHR